MPAAALSARAVNAPARSRRRELADKISTFPVAQFCFYGAILIRHGHQTISMSAGASHSHFADPTQIDVVVLLSTYLLIARSRMIAIIDLIAGLGAVGARATCSAP
jgi:hypothetical protein